MTPPTSLIINFPYEVPCQHWQQARDGALTLTPERRPAGYEIFGARHNTRRTETGVNAKGGFGVWCWDVAFVPAQLQDILAKHSH